MLRESPVNPILHLNQPLVDGEALQEITTDDTRRPNAELRRKLGIDTIAHGNDHVKVVERQGAGDAAPSLVLNLCNFCTG